MTPNKLFTLFTALHHRPNLGILVGQRAELRVIKNRHITEYANLKFRYILSLRNMHSSMHQCSSVNARVDFIQQELRKEQHALNVRESLSIHLATPAQNV